MIKKDGTIIELQGDIRLYDEELTKTLGVLSKVTQERDLMWQEVKEYSEKNMLLNREVESLKKKIEALEEDTLFKDGHISILKESLNKAKSYDILFDSEQANEFWALMDEYALVYFELRSKHLRAKLTDTPSVPPNYKY